MKIVAAEFGLLEDRVKRALLELAVIGDDHGDVALETVQEDMAPALVINDKADAVQSLDDLPAGKGPAQIATSTSRTVRSGLAMISLSFSSPSR